MSLFGPVLPHSEMGVEAIEDFVPTELDEVECGSGDESKPIDVPRRKSLASMWSSASTRLPDDSPEDSSEEGPEDGASDFPHKRTFSLATLFEKAHEPEPADPGPPAVATLSLEDVFPSPRVEVATWHPNRVLMAVSQVLCSRMSVKFSNTKIRGKRPAGPYRVISGWVRRCHASVSQDFTAGLRKNGRDTYRRIVATVCGMSIRQVTQATSAKWEKMSRQHTNAWAQMALFFGHSDVQPFLQGLVVVSTKTTKTLQARQADVRDIDANFVVTGYGFALCYNTQLGQNDAEVIRLLQRGFKGDALRMAMSEMPMYRDALDEAWNHFEPLGRSLGLPLVAVGIEHSEHGKHPGRVHYHVTMCLDVRGGLLGRSNKEVAVSRSVFEWEGLTPHVRPVNVRRSTCSAISAGIIQAYYYVAGPKTTSILRRCTAELFTDSCVHLLVFLCFAFSRSLSE